MEKRFRESKLIVPVTVVAAALGLTACGSTRGQGDIGLRNGVLSVPGESGGQVSTFECDSTTLKATIERNLALDKDIEIYNSSVCADGKITSADFAVTK